MTGEERKIIRECLEAVVAGSFIPDEEFETLMGLDRRELADIARRWGLGAGWEPKIVLAVNNAMNNLLGYPHGRDEDWSNFIAVPPEEVRELFSECRVLWGESEDSIQ